MGGGEREGRDRGGDQGKDELTSWGRSRALLPPPTSLIAANKRDYLPDKQLHARQLPKDARRNHFETGVVYTEEDGQCKTIDTAHRKVNLDDDTESWS